MRIILFLLAAWLICACSEQPGNATGPTSSSGNKAGAGMPSPTITPRASSARVSPEIDRQEQHMLEQSGQLAERNGKTLSLRLESGKTVEFTDSDNCESYEVCQIHVFGGLIADRHFFHLTTLFYEGSGSWVIARNTGEKFEVFDAPHVSPDGKFLVAAGASMLDRSGVFLWEIVDNKLVQRSLDSAKDNDLYQFVRWSGSDKVEILRLEIEPDGVCKQKYTQYPVRLVLQGKAWKLDDTVDKDKISCGS
jgi:hypothetical protein